MRHAPSHVLAGLMAGALGSIAHAQVCESSELVASQPGSGDQIGFSCAGHGDLAAVGAPFDDDVAGNAGAVYVYRYDGVAWAEQVKLTADDGAASDFFGAAVAVGENVVLVGAPFDDDEGSSTGAVYVFRFNGVTWTQEAKLLAEDANGQEEFGTAIVLSDGAAIIGAPREDLPAAGNAGAAYVFANTGANWTQQAKFVAQDAFADDGFGRSVDLDGNRAVIGAPFDDTGGSSSGSVYVFRRIVNNWLQEAKIIEADGDFNDLFGLAVAIRGNVVAAGAPGDDTLADGGSVSIFRRLAGAWAPEMIIPAPNATGNFGIAVSMRPGQLLVGNPGVDNNPVFGVARLYAYDGLDWIPTAMLIPSNGQLTDTFGSSVQLTETFAVIGAPSHDGSFSGAGTAYAFADLLQTDCNGNGIDDGCEIATMGAIDDDGNGIPDECQPVAGDTNGDGVTDADDLAPIIANFGACPAPPRPCDGDADGNGVVDIDDVIFVIINWTFGPIMDEPQG